MKDLYFLDGTVRTIFGLVELEAKKQMDFLGIDYEYFCDRKLAKNWYEKTKTELEASEHPMKDRAIENLNKLYKSMK
jgi:hypothetical protein|nr:MAG TPA: hypothetical protein [Caudoviricetes sp.]DAX95507.1 MAG TPA: hypothetical protein [Caudoviricetes sp.]